MGVGMAQFWGLFRQNRLYLSAYFAAQTLFLIGLLFVIRHFHLGIRHELPLPWLAVVVPLAVYGGLRLPTIMHNCMHGNLRRGNLLVGELTAFFILMSFGIVCIQHVLHHADPDTEKDPHSPAGLTFWQFFFFSQFRGVKVTETAFLGFHGPSLISVALFKFNIFCHFLGNLLRLGIWVALLGPLFPFVYVPAFLAYLFVFSHVNYTTHLRDADGNSVVINVEKTLYHRLINAICDGVYFHENHHLFPRRYNPKVATGGTR